MRNNTAIIGRKAEQETMYGCLESEKSEFIALYGRRRVGKTFLVYDNDHNIRAPQKRISGGHPVRGHAR